MKGSLVCNYENDGRRPAALYHKPLVLLNSLCGTAPTAPQCDEMQGKKDYGFNNLAGCVLCGKIIQLSPLARS